MTDSMAMRLAMVAWSLRGEIVGVIRGCIAESGWSSVGFVG